MGFTGRGAVGQVRESLTRTIGPAGETLDEGRGHEERRRYLRGRVLASSG